MDDTQYRTLRDLGRGDLARDLLKLIHSIMQLEKQARELSAQDVIQYYKPQDRFERNRVWKAIKYLEEQDRITVKRKDDRHFVSLTPQGEMKVAEEEVWEIAVQRPQRWDGKWRFVMFDVPTSHSRSRVLFKQNLDRLGFIQYQMSVFIYPFDCREEIQKIAEWADIDDYVRYIVADQIDDAHFYRRAFGLTLSE